MSPHSARSAIDRRRMEVRALRQECYVIQETELQPNIALLRSAEVYALPIYKHATPDGVRPLMNPLELHFYHCIL